MQTHVSTSVVTNVLPNNLPTLEIGSYSLGVAMLQRLLTFYSYLQPGNVVGSFADLTNAAIISFQADQRLTQDGIVGAGTWQALAMPNPSVNAKPIEAGSAASNDLPINLPTLGEASLDDNTGLAVAVLQRLLTCYGYNLAIDGLLGSETNQAIVDFQGVQGITQDGIVGANTWNALAMPNFSS